MTRVSGIRARVASVRQRRAADVLAARFTGRTGRRFGGGIRTVLIPEENRKDLADIPKNVTQGLKIIPVKWIDEVLDVALVRPLAPDAAAEPSPGTPGETGGKDVGGASLTH